MTIEAQLERLHENLDDLCQSVVSLDERLYLRPIRQWSARDIVAHLVGWNRYLVRGADQIKRGELPFYDIDPGPDYSHVNAVLVREYASTNRDELLDELRASAQELEEYLRSLDATEWDRDYGVRHAGTMVTIRNSIDELIDDYRHHREQISAWSETQTPARS
jgi:hypothetical protein